MYEGEHSTETYLMATGKNTSTVVDVHYNADENTVTRARKGSPTIFTDGTICLWCISLVRKVK